MTPRLVDTEAAELYSGRLRGTLYRWAAEGRITRHGTRGKGRALWDLDELAPAVPGQPLPPPPRLSGPQLTSA